MRLSRKKIIAIVFIACTVLVGWIVFQSIEKSRREHHIFCEGGLTRGMSKEDAIIYLQSFGDISYQIFWDNGVRFDGRETVYVGYMDEGNRQMGRTYALAFYDREYIGVSAIASFWEFKSIGTYVSVCGN